MKSKMKRRMLAIVLCMVIVLSNSSFIFASSESGTPAVEAASTEGTTSQTETDTQGTETTPQTLAVSESTPAPTDEPAAPTSVEATPTPTDTPEVTTTPEPTGTPTPEATPTPTDTPETTTTPEPTDTPEITTTPEPTDAPETTTTPEPTDTPEATPTPTQGPENGTSDTAQPTATPTPTEAPVKSNEAVELKQEFKDSDGNVTSTVKAQIPEGTFAADASEITMEVQTPDTASAEHVKEMMEELLPENHMLGDYIFYDIQFKVNGTVTEPQKPITITFEGNELSVKDVKRANVFWLDPEDPQVDGDKDQLVEITQKSEMIENLQNSGQSMENIDDYDLSEITLKEDGISDKIQMEGRTSTIYGCYVVYEPVQVLAYDDDQVTVTVSAAEEGIIPANAELKVVPIIAEDKNTEDQYKEVEQKLQEKAEKDAYDIAGFLAYDITFVDEDGNETEPGGEVKVSIDYKEAAIPETISEEDAANAEVTVLHLEEDEKGEVKEVVDMAQNEKVDVLATTEENKVEKAEVRTESFSKFAIIWRYGQSLDINVIDTKGVAIDEKLPDYNVNYNNISLVSITDISEKKEYQIDNYAFVKAIIGSNINSSEQVDNATQVSRIRYNNGWQYSTQSTGMKDWKGIGYNSIYFVYVGTIETADTAGSIDISLYDYNDNGEIINSGWNGSGLQFKGSGGSPRYNDYIGNWGVGYSDGGNDEFAVQGIVDGFLYTANGQKVEDYINYEGQLYPKLNVGSKQVLTELFDSKHHVASGLNHLFVKDEETGYYSYNSAEHYAYYNTDEEENPDKNFVVYDDFKNKGSDQYGEFMPLEDFNEGAKWYYGMTVGFNFIQPEGGKINGQDMTFEFSGDDDVWVFIDGRLVLDIGGIHGSTSGTINFATGEVQVEGVVKEDWSGIDNTLGKTTSLSTIFSLQGKTTFDNYTEHRLEFIYLERGAGDSNCDLKFNMPTIPKQGITVQKEIDNYDEGAYTDVLFQYKLFLEDKDSATGFSQVTEGEYTVKRAGSSGQGETFHLEDNENGIFTLKHGEMATFEGLAEVGTEYYVQEIGLSQNEYDQVKITGSSITDEKGYFDYTDSPTEGAIAQTNNLTIGQDPYVVFHNRCAATNMKQLSITKDVDGGTTNDEFTICVKIAGQPYVGDYWIGTNGYGSDDISSNGHTENGEITIKEGQTITVLGNVKTEDGKTVGFPSGTSFEVVEKNPGENYTGVTYKVENGGDRSSTDGKASGEFQFENNAEIVVTNHLVQPEKPEDNPSDVPINKKIDWLGGGTDNPDTALDDDYFYRLYLDATGIPDTIPKGADIVLILDMSNSMRFDMNGNGDIWNDEDEVPEDTWRLNYVKDAAKQAVETIKSSCSQQGVNNINIGLVTFNYGNASHEGTYENGTKILSKFTNQYDDLIDIIDELDEYDLKGRTNYEAAFAATDQLLGQSTQANKYVVFITDGETNGYTDGGTGFEGNDKEARGKEKYTNPDSVPEGNKESLEQAQDIAQKWTKLSGFYTIAVSSDIEADTLKTLGPRNVPRLDIQANDKEAIEKAFSTIVSTITKQVCDVTITDTLSKYVEFVNETGETLEGKETVTGNDIALKVTKTVNGQTETLSSDAYTVTVDTDDNNHQRVRVNFGTEYFLEPGAIYTVSFNVKLTDQAFIDDMNNTGEPETDYETNEEYKTSSEKIGHFSNTSATLTYSTVRDGELTQYTKVYPKPVVQVQARQDWTIYKKSDSTNGAYLGNAVFELKNGNATFIGTSNSGETKPSKLGYVEWTDKNENPIKETEIPVGEYTLTEIKAPNGFALSSVSWQVIIKNMETPEIRPILEGGTLGKALPVEDTETSDGRLMIVITNTPVFDLPSSGSSGIFGYTMGGTLLLMAGTLILYKMKRKEVQES